MVYKRIFSITLALLFLILSSAEAKIKEEAIRYRIRGYQKQHQGSLDEAVELYQRAVIADPTYPAPHNDLGVIYEERGELQRAEASYRKALEIDSHYVDAYSNLASLYEKTQEKEKMLEALRKRVSLGEASDIGTQEAKAKLETLGITMQLPPKQPRVAFSPEPITPAEVETPSPPMEKSLSTAKVKEIKQDIKEVKKEIKKREIAQKVTPEKKEEVKEAVKEEVVVREMPPPPVQGVQKPSREVSKKKIEEDPKREAVFLRNEGLRHQQEGELDEAIRYYRAAIKTYPDFATAYNDLGVVLEEKGDFDKAEKAYLDAISIDGAYKNALYNLSLLYEKIHQPDNAARYLEQFVIQEGIEGDWQREAHARLKLLQIERREEEMARIAEGEKERQKKREEKERMEVEAALREKLEREAQAKAKADFEKRAELTSLFEEGKQAYRGEEYATAQGFFEKILLFEPKNELAHSYLKKTEKKIEKMKEEEERKKREEEEKRRRAEALRREQEAARLRALEEAKRQEEERKRQEAEAARLQKEKEEKERLEREAQAKALAEKKRLEEEARQEKITSLYEEAKMLYRDGDLESALPLFEQLMTLDPDHPYAGRYAERIEEKKKEEEAARLRKIEEERARAEAARKAEEERREKIASRFEAGKRMIQNESYQAALEAFEEVLSLDPDHRDAKRYLSKAEEGIEKEKKARHKMKLEKKQARMEAIEEYQKSMAEEFYTEGLKVFRRGELDKAGYAFEKALFFDPDHRNAKKQLGLVQERQSEKEAKIWREKQEKTYRKEYTEVEEKRLYERAKAAFEVGDYALAKKTLEYLLVLNPSHPYATEDLEEVEKQIKKDYHRDALETARLKKEARRLIDTPPERRQEDEFLRAQAGPDAEHKKYASMEDLIADEADKASQASSSMESIALAYQQKAYDLQSQDIEKAIGYYQKAQAIKPSAGSANGLGVLYERKGWLVQAESAYKMALSLAPDYLPAHTNLALLYEKLERHRDAMRHWRVRAEMGAPGDFWTQKAQAYLEIP